MQKASEKAESKKKTGMIKKASKKAFMNGPRILGFIEIQIYQI